MDFAKGLKQPFMDKSKFIVFAYMEQHRRELFKDVYNDNIYYNNMPDLVLNTCLLFYHSQKDEWDRDQVGSRIAIIRETVKLSSGSDCQSAFLSNIVDQDIHIWKFKLKRVAKKGSWKMVGIWKINVGYPILHSPFTSRKYNGYGYVFGVARKTNIDKRTYDWGPSYGVTCKSGDIVEMIVDFKELSLSYRVNGNHQGVAFKIDKTKYRAAVSMDMKGDMFTLLQYERKKNLQD